MTTERSINLAVIAGDGIGPEIITEAQRVLQRACELDSIRVDSTDYKLGAEHWLKTGETLPESTMESLNSTMRFFSALLVPIRAAARSPQG